MEFNSEASQTARFSLSVHDETASFYMNSLYHKRVAGSVMDAMHWFHDEFPVIRRRWTDAAPEFVAAAGLIASFRLLAHCKNASYRHQVNERAEQCNRLIIDNTKCFLFQFDFGEKWCALAITLFFINCNALFEGPNGLTPWIKTCGLEHEFRPSPFGAPVLYIHLP